jgi:endonuclease/exonuclease/phosphatase family metal-dependent hydrolase
MCKKIIFAVCVIALVSSSQAAEKIRVATWNIEHLGSSGRGLGGIGSGNLPKRSPEQLKKIATFIKNDIKADLIAVQEVAVSGKNLDVYISESLETIVDELGDDWSYYIDSTRCNMDYLDSHENMSNAFIWNAAKVRAVKMFSVEFPNEYVGKKPLFDREPLVGYFEMKKGFEYTNDFLITNVHLTSGQDNDENHIVAMVIIEQNMNTLLKSQHIKESDRIILGDFNDNPFAKDDANKPEYTDLLYKYMEWKKYTDLVNETTGATRMDANLSSTIDHILVNNSAANHLTQKSKKNTERIFPQGDLAQWRQTYSDHFPLVIEIKVENKDDDVD